MQVSPKKQIKIEKGMLAISGNCEDKIFVGVVIDRTEHGEIIMRNFQTGREAIAHENTLAQGIARKGWVILNSNWLNKKWAS